MHFIQSKILGRLKEMYLKKLNEAVFLVVQIPTTEKEADSVSSEYPI
jgi:hypothetical protein